MTRLTSFEWNGKTDPVKFIETQQVKDGVICDVYEFTEDNSKDLGIITVTAGSKTPRQKILAGDRTIEGIMSGEGSLTVAKASGESLTYNFPGETSAIELHVGDIMQWEAKADLSFYEICYPAYSDGRFQNLD